MKKLSTYLFLILFTLQAPSWADDITDFQIEGMSIGDSLLDLFSEEEIKNNLEFFYDNNKFISFTSKHATFETYDAVQFHFKSNDKKYIIHSMDGTLIYDNKINECHKEKDKIVKELTKLFGKKTTIEDLGTYSHSYDKSGKSKVSPVYFDFKDGSSFAVACTDWSEELTKEKGFTDRLKVSMDSKDFNFFINNEAYK